MRSRMLIATCALLLLGTTSHVGATPPTQMAVQGRLTDAAGVALPAGPKNFVFRIYDDSTSGTRIWPNAPAGEILSITTDSAGLWSTVIGGFHQISNAVFADAVRWLEIEVEGTKLPRTRLVTGPYAFRVASIDGAAGGMVSGDLNLNSGRLTVGPGHTNTGQFSFVTGESNAASGDFSSVGGGRMNVASGIYAVLGGGELDTASGDYATVGGGSHNIASGNLSVVGGGWYNRAEGAVSFAAGQFAHALHPNSFVWNDGSAAIEFVSTAAQQFLVHAAGGVGIGINAPQGELHVRRGSGATGAVAHAHSIAVFEGDLAEQSYISILSPESAERGLLFGGPINASDGAIIYNSSGTPDGLEFRINGNAVAMKLAASGYLAIGSLTGPHSNVIQVPNNADESGRGLANAWSSYSSRRWKTDIHTIENALMQVEQLRGVTYRSLDGGSQQIGLIAEEVGEVVPQVVQYEENGVDAQSIDYARLVALLIEGMKEQQQRIEALEKKLERQAP